MGASLVRSVDLLAASVVLSFHILAGPYRLAPAQNLKCGGRAKVHQSTARGGRCESRHFPFRPTSWSSAKHLELCPSNGEGNVRKSSGQACDNKYGHSAAPQSDTQKGIQQAEDPAITTCKSYLQDSSFLRFTGLDVWAELVCQGLSLVTSVAKGKSSATLAGNRKIVQNSWTCNKQTHLHVECSWQECVEW
eukprot:5857772-Amphidinium_carterae.1